VLAAIAERELAMAEMRKYKQGHSVDSRGVAAVAGAILSAFIAIAIIEEKHRLS